MAYAIRFCVESREFENAAKMYRYNSAVFVLPPWREIFVNDSERRLSYEMSLAFYRLIVDAYKDSKYNLVEVPMGSIEDRAKFVLDRV
ncbi:MAG: AAA family ATPase [Proteobacteria bacterium]|nr:AAA family ATPase [Pseudomonadota bacterium]